MEIMDIIQCPGCKEVWTVSEEEHLGEFLCPNCAEVWLEWEPDFTPDWDAAYKDHKMGES